MRSRSSLRIAKREVSVIEAKTVESLIERLKSCSTAYEPARAIHLTRDAATTLRSLLDALNEADDTYSRARMRDHQEIEALRGERDALKADAERFQWAISDIANADYLTVLVGQHHGMSREGLLRDIDGAVEASKEQRG